MDSYRCIRWCSPVEGSLTLQIGNEEFPYGLHSVPVLGMGWCRPVCWRWATVLGVTLRSFYLGYPGLGVSKLLTLGGAGLWWIADIILLLSGKSVAGIAPPNAVVV